MKPVFGTCFLTTIHNNINRQQYFVVIDAISGEPSSRFSQSAIEKLEFIETTLLEATHDRLMFNDRQWNGPTAVCLQYFSRPTEFQKIDSEVRMLSSLPSQSDESKRV